MQITSVRYRKLVSLRGCEHKALEAEPAYNRFKRMELPGSLWRKNRTGLTASIHLSALIKGSRQRRGNERA